MGFFYFSALDYSQNRYRLRYIRAQRSELFRVFARRLAYEMVNIEKFDFRNKIILLERRF